MYILIIIYNNIYYVLFVKYKFILNTKDEI